MRTVFFLLTLFTLPVVAQTRLQVVTKTVEKELPYRSGQRVNLVAQKADVSVKGWVKPTVLIRLKLIAKHPERDVAERELAFLKYTIELRNNVVELANHFVIPQRVGAVKSNLKAVYEIWLPMHCPVALSNTFGDVNLSDLSGETTLTLEFGKLSIQHLSGKTAITSEYGDIDASELSGTFTIKGEKAEIILRDLGGSGRIQSRYGKIAIHPIASLTALTVLAARTEVSLFPRRIDDFLYDIEATYSVVQVPEGYSEHLRSKKRRFVYPSSGPKPVITVRNSYSPVIIQPTTGGVTLAK